MKFSSLSILLGIICINFTKATSDVVFTRLSLIPEDESYVKYVEDKLLVSCFADYNDSLAWFGPHGNEIDRTEGRVHVQMLDYELLLLFDSIQKEDQGKWTCAIFCDEIEEEKSFTLNVFVPIRFEIVNPIVTANETEDVVLPCDVYGSPQPTVHWYYNDGALNEEVSENLTYSALGDGLLIRNLKRELGGEYTCKAFQISQVMTNVEEQTILLNVQFKPVVHHHHKNMYAISNGEVNLTCEANALPHPEFSWYRDGRRLYNKPIHNEDFHSVLTLSIASKDDFGSYSCKAKNLLGEETITFSLSEGTMPEKPKVLMLRGLSSDTFDIDVGAKRDPYRKRHVMDVRGYRFELIPKHVYQEKKSWKKAIVQYYDFADGATYLVNNLQEDTTYLTRVASRNLAGYSEWTDVVEFTTLLKQPKFVTASAVSKQLNLHVIFIVLTTTMSSSSAMLKLEF